MTVFKQNTPIGQKTKKNDNKNIKILIQKLDITVDKFNTSSSNFSNQWLQHHRRRIYP
jgi:hypothetical protein